MRAWLRAHLRRRGYLWFRKPLLPWGLDLQSDLQRWFDLDAFDCVVDVGAHVGTMSLAFARMCPRARVIAFEMVPATFETLRRNVQPVERILPQCVGLSDESGEVTIAIESDGQLNSLRNRTTSPPDAGSVSVRVRRLDDLAPELGISTIDLLKVDAEGFDLQVMKGAAGLFAAGRVGAVYAEVDFGNSSRTHGNFGEIAAWLAPHGLYPLAFYDPIVLARDGAPYLDYTNVLFVGKTLRRCRGS